MAIGIRIKLDGEKSALTPALSPRRGRNVPRDFEYITGGMD
jgi:hypothetical protein